MKLFASKKKTNEHYGVAVLLSTSLTLHIVWILSLMATRSEEFERFLATGHNAGVFSGLYGLGFAFFLLSFFLIASWFKSKDCSHIRVKIFHFFLLSIIVFSIMSFPLFYGVR